ncbi:hypothetical protein P7D22_09070 [Lichenihabitans sp. Uapishka_5]|uniref:hypothetical protein n=1 Tax=Lichenihabitans sp. Uapishka_5 TaxID=3037302 RepID=UPI0029E7D61A|nr:hypothetical protein [Lichenihabitans sp. Uapishka_5]MDX7951326.1 hypothetical protein [Lichenihabitans sp. Uapishka_5]
MPDAILSPSEVTAAVIGLAQAIYTAHVHAGRACLTIDDAVGRACMIVGLAQSDMWHQVVQNAVAAPLSATYEHEAREQVANDEIAREQYRRIDMFARALNRREVGHVETNGDGSGVDPADHG